MVIAIVFGVTGSSVDGIPGVLLLIVGLLASVNLTSRKLVMKVLRLREVAMGQLFGVVERSLAHS